MPDTNEDLIDPTSDDEGLFKIAYDKTNEKIIIFRAAASEGGEITANSEWQLYYEQ